MSSSEQWPNSARLVSPDNEAATHSSGDGPKLQAESHLANCRPFPFQCEKSVLYRSKKRVRANGFCRTPGAKPHLKAREHFVPLPASLDEELPENSNQQNKPHPKRKAERHWHAGSSVPGPKPQLPCLSAGASTNSPNRSATRQESTPTWPLAWEGCGSIDEKAFCKQ